ncbi:hypothetical protein [uncultured Brachyspira sp.]|uniref:hypothetical protein n=1 Tax=uncultured Brachyspira sp. TaxID=221953 RepID=UPI0027DD53D2|nr:hypothetical protein [uncultured Brachyspira sp.]
MTNEIILTNFITNYITNYTEITNFGLNSNTIYSLTKTSYLDIIHVGIEAIVPILIFILGFILQSKLNKINRCINISKEFDFYIDKLVTEEYLDKYYYNINNDNGSLSQQFYYLYDIYKIVKGYSDNINKIIALLEKYEKDIPNSYKLYYPKLKSIFKYLKYSQTTSSINYSFIFDKYIKHISNYCNRISEVIHKEINGYSIEKEKNEIYDIYREIEQKQKELDDEFNNPTLL